MPRLTNFHLLLSPELHGMLREEAERSGKTVTALVREALQSWLTQRRKRRLHEEIAAWATEHAGTALDLDRELETAGLELLGRPPAPTAAA